MRIPFLLVMVLALTVLMVPVIATANDVSPREFRTRMSHTYVTVSDMVSDVEAEIDFGKEVAARILGTYPPLHDDELNRYVNLVGRSLALHSNRSELEFRFMVLDTPTLNAYAAPGGYVFITAGALEMMEDEAELAAVLAHEIAHVNEKHIVKELNIRGVEETSISGISRFLGGASDPARVAFAQAIDRAVEIMFQRGYLVEDEYEADYIGTLLLAQTGYDPAALKRYLQRVDESASTDAAETLNRTHPETQERLDRMAAQLNEYGLQGLPYPTMKQRFQQHVDTKGF
ncbi:M48 family metalloprotease [Desulfurispira natronophila]|uniref:Putative Zn-dependent protease n=1 Tax=Desulfurispira natronophila TaxID=682562 RepID=A0A7W7Y2M3_9BACT|nr:M48 family metalloprotease [Desulfurispira natronophila]MBB5020938.1 putative Zn-dependent protease [Desulfurispira natronophila]